MPQMKSQKARNIVPLDTSNAISRERGFVARDPELSRLGDLAGGFIHLCKDLSIDEKDVQTLVRRTHGEGFKFLTMLLPSFGKSFDFALGKGVLAKHSFEGFQHRPDGYIPLLFGDLISQVFDEEGYLRLDANADCVRKVRQVCFYAYKANFPYDSGADEARVSQFVETERELSQFVKTATLSGGVLASSGGIPLDPILKVSRLIVNEVFTPFDETKLLPKNGPGITANVPLTKKWDYKLEAGMGVLKDYGRLFFFSPVDAFDRLDRFPVFNHSSYFHTKIGKRASKALLVPKDSRGPRLICAEPAEQQFVQQAVMAQMIELIDKSVASGQVNFLDQTINQRLARETSVDQTLATLDLKDASDRVLFELVRLLFGGTPSLLNAITACRTSQTIMPDGRVVDLVKHAPMGSALCFPVMAVTIYVLLVSYLLGRGYSLDLACRSVWVYGDDIIMPAAMANGGIATLERYGLKVNVSKSFIGARFAESCGADCFDGQIVTPTRLRTVMDYEDFNEKTREQFIVNAVKHGHELTEKGYHHCANYWYSLVESEPFIGSSLPPCVKTSAYLGRLVDPDVFFADLKHWRDEHGVRSRKVRVLYVSPIDTKASCTPWGHLNRIRSSIGSGQVVKRGVFNLPRDWKLREKHLVLEMENPKPIPVPEWITALFGLND